MFSSEGDKPLRFFSLSSPINKQRNARPPALFRILSSLRRQGVRLHLACRAEGRRVRGRDKLEGGRSELSQKKREEGKKKNFNLDCFLSLPTTFSNEQLRRENARDVPQVRQGRRRGPFRGLLLWARRLGRGKGKEEGERSLSLKLSLAPLPRSTPLSFSLKNAKKK